MGKKKWSKPIREMALANDTSENTVLGSSETSRRPRRRAESTHGLRGSLIDAISNQDWDLTLDQLVLSYYANRDTPKMKAHVDAPFASETKEVAASLNSQAYHDAKDEVADIVTVAPPHRDQ